MGMQKQSLTFSFSFLLIAFLIVLTFLFSCKKDKNETNAVTFYGKWKTSYGDTVTFTRVNGKNVIRYDASMNPGLPMQTTEEYTYRNNKLGIRSSFSSIGDFRMMNTFQWIDEGRSFKIQGVEWFVFMSSTATWFTFTKIL